METGFTSGGTTNPGDTEEKSYEKPIPHRLGTGGITGIVVSALVTFAIIVAVIVWRKRASGYVLLVVQVIKEFCLRELKE